MIEGHYHSDELHRLVSDILREAKQQGATDAEVDVGINHGFSVSARQGKAESIEYNQDKLIDLTVYFGQRTGSSSLSDFRPEAIQAAVRAACSIARFTDQDDCAGLADAALMARHYPNLDLSHPWAISVEQAVELACECEAKALAQDKRITQAESVSVATGNAWHAYGNTRDFIGVFPTSRHEISCVLVAKQGDDMQRDYSYTVSRDPSLLESVDNVANQAVHRTVRRLGARRIATQQVPVIFAAEEARHLLSHFISAISGSHLYRKSSFLLDQLNKPIFPAHITIEERPHLPKLLGSSPFDDNGVATRNNRFIDEGILKSYVLGVYSARQLKMQTTGNAGGVHNLFITTSNKDLSALLKTMNRGLLVTEVMGQGVNLVTGDYSRGAAGFWIESGEIQYPVQEITIASNLRDLYLHLIEVGSDIDTRGNILTGSILVNHMMVAGN